MPENKSNYFNIFDEKEVDFLALHNAMDSFFRQLHSEDIRANSHQSNNYTIYKQNNWHPIAASFSSSRGSERVPNKDVDAKIEEN